MLESIKYNVFQPASANFIDNPTPSRNSNITVSTPSSASAKTALAFKANQLGELDMDVLDSIRVNHFAAAKRVATLCARRSVKGSAQTHWLAKAVSCIDLTTLAGDDTAGRVARLCGKAMAPIRMDVLDRLGIAPGSLRCAAVCVYPSQIQTAKKALGNSGLSVAAVATGFPAGQISHANKLQEIKHACRQGANEIDIVISRENVLSGQWRKLYKEVSDFVEAAGDAHVKAILAIGDLRTLRNVAKASMVAMMAGAHFIKTSTGKEDTNATLIGSLIMLRAIREHNERTGAYVGFKPAGGVSTTKTAIQYQILVLEELGARWCEPDLFRIGASSLLGDIERQLEHQASGSYSASRRHPVA